MKKKMKQYVKRISTTINKITKEICYNEEKEEEKEKKENDEKKEEIIRK